MNNKQIQSFISVIENKSISAAAKKQYISPQAMLQQIDLLEKEVGVPLLNRTNKGVTPTAAGKEFYSGIVSLNKEMSSLLQKVRTVDNDARQTLRIGIFSTNTMNRICERFSLKYPDIQQQFTLIAASSWLKDLDLLYRHELDLFEHADVLEVHQKGLSFIPLFQSPCLCALSASHPLSNKERIYPNELDGNKIAIHAQSCVPGLKELLEQEAPHATLVNLSNGISSAFPHCMNGGVFIIAEIFAEKHKPLRIIPLECNLHWTFGLVCKENPPQHVRLFIDHAKEMV